MGTRTEQRKAKILRENYFNQYMIRFRSLFHNSVEVEIGKDLVSKEVGELPKRYLLRVLLDKGGIAYHKELKLFLPFVAEGINVYGLPKMYTLIGYDGFNVRATPEEVVILRANDLCEPVINYFEQQANKIVDLDMAIKQNLDAIKTMSIIEVADEATLLSLENEDKARRLGCSVAYRNKSLHTDGESRVFQTGAEFLVDKLLEARKEVINETLSTIGIAVANTDKRERVQGMEVLASQGYALDCINTLIDTFNYDAEYGDIDIRLKGNTSLVEQNEKEIEQLQKGENNENETDDKIS